MKKELDFSQFHPLDHRIGSRYCREVTNFPTSPKGWANVRIHARYWWDFKGRDKVRRNTLCRIGIHREVTWYSWKPEFKEELRRSRTLPPRPGDPPDERWNETRCCAACHKTMQE